LSFSFLGKTIEKKKQNVWDTIIMTKGDNSQQSCNTYYVPVIAAKTFQTLTYLNLLTWLKSSEVGTITLSILQMRELRNEEAK